MKNKNAGFSLIELIVVIAVMVIVAGIGISWISRLSGYRARECASKVASTLNGAKVKSLSKQQNTGDAYWELKKGSDGRYYVSVLVEEPEREKPVLNDFGIGIDLGVKDFAICSNGKTYKNK